MKFGNSNGVDGYWQWSTALAERIPHVWLAKTGLVDAAAADVAPADVLDIHTRHLMASQTRPAPATIGRATREDEIAALSRLAEQVALSVRPVYPAPRFRRELRRALLSAHRQQSAQRRIFAHPLFEQGLIDRTLLERVEINSPWFWQMAAAVPVLLAVTALIWRYTHRVEEQAGEVVA